MTFYNTTALTGDRLKAYRQSAQTQEDIIHGLFKAETTLSPSQVDEMTGNAWPITSIRRAISDLTREGRLEKLDRMVEGKYGKPEHVWRFVERLNYQPPRMKSWQERNTFVPHKGE